MTRHCLSHPARAVWRIDRGVYAGLPAPLRLPGANSPGRALAARPLLLRAARPDRSAGHPGAAPAVRWATHALPPRDGPANVAPRLLRQRGREISSMPVAKGRTGWDTQQTSGPGSMRIVSKACTACLRVAAVPHCYRVFRQVVAGPECPRFCCCGGFCGVGGTLRRRPQRIAASRC